MAARSGLAAILRDALASLGLLRMRSGGWKGSQALRVTDTSHRLPSIGISLRQRCSVDLALQPQNLPRLGRRRDVVAQDLDDVRRLLDECGIAGRELALREIEVVLKPDAHVPAKQHR